VSSFAIPPDLSWADADFDGMMVSRLAVYKKQAILDGYGQVVGNTSTMIEVARDIPCFVQPLTGQELNTPPAPASQTSYGVQQFKIFLRPTLVDTPERAISIRDFFQILTKTQVDNGDSFLDPNDPNNKVLLFNITNISNPANWDHHLEITATVLTP